MRCRNERPVESADVDVLGCLPLLRDRESSLLVEVVVRDEVEPGFFVDGLKSADQDKEAGRVVLLEENSEGEFREVLECDVIDEHAGDEIVD